MVYKVVWLRLEMWDTLIVKTALPLWRDFTTFWIFFFTRTWPNFVQILPSPRLLPFLTMMRYKTWHFLCLLWQIFFFSSLKRNKWQRGMNFGEIMWSESSRFCIVRVRAVTEGQKQERGTQTKTEQACWSCKLHFLRITISSNKLVQFTVAGFFLEWGWGGGYKPTFIFFSSVFGMCNQPHLLSVFQR